MLTNAAISSGPKGEYFLRRRGEYEQRYERYRRTRPSGSRDTPYNILAPARPGNEPKFFDRLRADYGQGSRSFPQLRPRAFLLRRALELTYSSIPTTQRMLPSGGPAVYRYDGADSGAPAALRPLHCGAPSLRRGLIGI